MAEDDQNKAGDQKQPTDKNPDKGQGEGPQGQPAPKKRKVPVKLLLIGGAILLIILFFGYR
jgi:hypothetical protein